MITASSRRRESHGQRVSTASGNPVAPKVNTAADEWTVLFQGATLDTKSGLYTMGYRQYSTSLGRWIEQDPAGYVDGANLYQFVGSEPTAAVDPRGLAPTSQPGGGVIKPLPGNGLKPTPPASQPLPLPGSGDQPVVGGNAAPSPPDPTTPSRGGSGQPAPSGTGTGVPGTGATTKPISPITPTLTEPCPANTGNAWLDWMLDNWGPPFWPKGGKAPPPKPPPTTLPVPPTTQPVSGRSGSGTGT